MKASTHYRAFNFCCRLLAVTERVSLYEPKKNTHTAPICKIINYIGCNKYRGLHTLTARHKILIKYLV